MKLTNCKRCDAKNVYWEQNYYGKWEMKEENGSPHACDDGKIKAVKCKYCPANDLHWAEEIDPITKAKRMVLTESYGLQHACDERINFLAAEKKKKSDKYEAEKKRVTLHEDGTCPKCKGGGHNPAGTINQYEICDNCHGYCSFNERNRKGMLAVVRRNIWPNMKGPSYSKWRYK